MVFKVIVAVYSRNHTKHINTLCGHNVFFNAKSDSVSRNSLVATVTGYALDGRGSIPGRH
jgi:hypothetical protein